MSVDVVVRDETTSGEVIGELALALTAERTTVGEIIGARVAAEVRAHNADAVLGRFRGLVQPTGEEERLNGRRPHRRVDPEAQVAVALQAFERGQILVLVDDRQRTELGEVVTLKTGSTVTFLRLVPLVGG